MLAQSLYHTYQRYKTLQTHHITTLPVVILMPHSACNCRCVMCDIWKGNKNLKQLSEQDIAGLLTTFKKFGTRQVVMSGGEALLHPAFFQLCSLLRQQQIKITLLSTGLALKKNADQIIEWINEVIVSLDGDEATHDQIRNIAGAFGKMKEGIVALKSRKPDFTITARTVIHKYNFKIWPSIIDSAKEIGVDKISFLPADISSTAFNRSTPWDVSRQNEVAISKDELPELEATINHLLDHYQNEFVSGFIAESPKKIKNIYYYYCAVHGLCNYPFKKCNAPWVSTVVEADGTVKPCFFHASIGNIHQQELDDILNSSDALEFRKHLNMVENETCKKCVCSLNLPPWKALQ